MFTCQALEVRHGIAEDRSFAQDRHDDEQPQRCLLLRCGGRHLGRDVAQEPV